MTLHHESTPNVNKAAYFTEMRVHVCVYMYIVQYTMLLQTLVRSVGGKPSISARSCSRAGAILMYDVTRYDFVEHEVPCAKNVPATN